MEAILLFLLFAGKSSGLFFEDLFKQAGNSHIPKTGSDVESLIFRSCYVCHGTSISAVTSSCWETVDEDHTRFVSVESCFGACSITVLNHTRISLIDYTRKCEPTCTPSCHLTDQNTHLCKYCCYGDRCNNVLPTYVPKGPEMILGVSEANLATWLKGSMAKPRHHAEDPSNKIAARKFIMETWREFGLPPYIQEFRIAQTVEEERSPFNYKTYIKTVIKGYNIIATLRGRNYGTINDKILIVIGHYDTHSSGTRGIDDNASGVASLLELSRLLNRNETCERNNTIMLVATDFNKEGSFWDGLREQDYINCITGNQYNGLVGVSHFLCGYLLPHLRKTGSRAMLGINLDSLLNYDTRPASQSLPKMQGFLTGRSRDSNSYQTRFQNQISKRKYRGDWILVSYVQVNSNSQTTKSFADAMASTWNNLSHSSLKAGLIKQHIPFDGNEASFMQIDDCLPFNRLRQSISCLSVSDTGSWRGYMTQCQNQNCDESNHMTTETIKFLAKVTDTVWRMLEKVSESSCLPPRQTSSALIETSTSTTSTKAEQTLSNTSTTSPTTKKTSAKRRCKKPLLKTSSRRKNNISIGAVCRYRQTGLELCTPPNSGIWASLNGGTAWIPRKSKKKNNQNLWFQVNLGQKSEITKIGLQGVPRKGYVRAFMLSFSKDGSSWNWYIPSKPLARTATGIRGSKKAKRPVKRALKPTVSAQFIRIHPLKWKRRIALRVELYGCFK